MMPRSFSAVLVIFSALVASSQAALSTVDKQRAVDAHNNYRSMEAASNMLQMTWDPTLASIAQAYAQLCNFQHNSARSSQYTTGAPNPVDTYVGENLFVTSAGESAGLIGSAIQSWYDEKLIYNLATGVCNGVCGHYTQIVWAQSYLVGCGSNYCQSVSGFNSRAGTLIVCDYAPGGNYVGEAPYTSGTPCTKCPSLWPGCYNNSLCSKNSTQVSTPSNSTTPMNSTVPPNRNTSSNATAPSSASTAIDHRQFLLFALMTITFLLVTN